MGLHQQVICDVLREIRGVERADRQALVHCTGEKFGCYQ